MFGVLMCAVFAFAIKVDLDNSREAAERSAEIVAASYATHLNKTLANIDALTRVVAREYQRSTTPYDLNSLVGGGAITPDSAAQITVVNASGVTTQNWPTRHSPVDLSDREHFVVQKNSSSSSFYVGVPVRGRISGNWTLQFTRRLNSKTGAFDGIVVVSERPEYLSDGFINSATTGRDGVLLAFRSDGGLLARKGINGPAEVTGLTLANYLSAFDTQAGELIDPVDHVQRYFAYAPVPGYPVIAAVAISEHEALAGYRQRRIYYIVFAALTALLLVASVVSILAYVGKLRIAEDEMRRLAETDPLTELENRRSLRQCVEKFFARGSVSSDSIALLMLDLSDFGRINDLLGQDAGDAMLRVVATRLREVTAGRYRVARVGGDEFGLLVEGPNALARARGLACAAIESFSLAIGLRGHSYVMKASIGVAGNGATASTVSELWRNANRAMSAAKQAVEETGDSQVRMYTASMAERLDKDENDFHALLDAMQKKEIALEYAPVLRVDHSLAVAARASLVWHRPGIGRHASTEFLPLATKHDLSYRLNTYLIEEAWQQIEALPDALAVPIFVSVPAEVVMQGDLSEFVDYMVASGSTRAGRLWLGIEGLERLRGNEHAIASLHKVKDKGLKLYAANITGDWSVSAMRALPVSAVEIGADLFANRKTDRISESIVVGILASCAELGLTTLVGGVTSPEQVEWLKRYEGVWAYGAHFSDPYTAEDLRVLRGVWG